MSGTKHEWAIMAALSAHDGCKSRNRGKHGMWMEAAIAAYQRVMREPAEDEVRVRVCVAVNQYDNGTNGYNAAGWSGAGDAGAKKLARDCRCGDFAEPQFRWIEANVPAWTPPAEETVEGEVVP